MGKEVFSRYNLFDEVPVIALRKEGSCFGKCPVIVLVAV